MAHIRQEQRQALEEVFRHQAPITTDLDGVEAIMVDGEPLAFWGMSLGYGTCARIDGVSVAIVGDPSKGQTPIGQPFMPRFVFSLRQAQAEELDEYERLHGIIVMIVELLLLEKISGRRVFFTSSGRRNRYVHRCA